MSAPADSAYRRRKQPEQVRRALIDCAARIAAEDGLGRLTLEAVARAAGVTKGGLLHHFDSKQALIAALFADLLGKLGDEIAQSMETDSKAEGRFTRAYVRACFADRLIGAQSLWAALSVAILSEPALRALWSDWLDEQLTAHLQTDADPALAVVRLAADGVWLADMLERDRALERYPQDLETRLLALAGG